MSRDGSLSDFPNNIDSFPVLYPYNLDRDNGSNPTTRNDLERATHINQYFDAAFNLERFLQSKVRANLAGRSPAEFKSADGGGLVFTNEDLLLATNSVNLSISSGVASGLVNVPAIFGANPFDRHNFAIAHTTYLPATEPLKGVATSTNDQEWLNALIRVPLLFTSIAPISGTLFKVEINTAELLDAIYNQNVFHENCYRPMGAQNNLAPGWSETTNTITTTVTGNWNSNGVFGGPAMGIEWDPSKNGGDGILWQMSCGAYGFWYHFFFGEYWQPKSAIATASNLNLANNHTISFEYYKWYAANSRAGYNQGRSGFLIRGSGPVTAVSGFFLVLGDTPWTTGQNPNTYRTGKVYRLMGADMTKCGYAKNTVLTDCPGSSLLATFDMPNTVGIGNKVCHYTFGVTGTVLHVKRSIDGAAYTVVANVNLGLGNISGGTAGLFVLPFRYYVPEFDPDPFPVNNNAYFAYKNITITNGSGANSQTATVNLLYSMVGDVAHTTFENI